VGEIADMLIEREMDLEYWRHDYVPLYEPPPNSRFDRRLGYYTQMPYEMRFAQVKHMFEDETK